MANRKASHSGMPKRILIVDDEPDFQELLRYHLTGPDCEVVVAGNFASAMLAAQVQPDLILLDIMLPDVDGLSLCEALKGQPQLIKAPVWIVSAAKSQATRDIARAAGATEFFEKPIDLLALKACFREWLDATGARETNAPMN